MSNTSNTATPQDSLKFGDQLEIIDTDMCEFKLGEIVLFVKESAPWTDEDTAVFVCVGEDGCLQYLDRFQFKKFQS